ncbi:immunoglobulin-like domain-containing protein [Arcanobacterium hippocoleae]|uniref:immunoglobulin-like domain-containing protein n=1 Tax=Arcanobacterium hippocoleae TaxID=149017 RepID=UPI00333E68BF
MKMRQKKIFWILLGVIFVFIVALAAVFFLNKWIVTVQLHGAQRMTVEYGEKWDDPGASAAYRGSIFKFIGTDLPIATHGKVDAEKLGEYEIEYTAQAYGMSSTAKRIVEVKDTKAPEIKLAHGAQVELMHAAKWGETFTATDNVDGDLTAKVHIAGSVNPDAPGEYELTYQVTDASGNTATQIQKVKVLPPKSDVVDPAAGKDKVIYLTFDDGPSVHTARLLDILKARNVPVTFFVTGTAPREMIGRAAREGHSIGVHTYTHDYAQIYASDAAFWADIEQIAAVVREQTGKDTRLLRFAGGGSNTVSRKYSPGIMRRLVQQAAQKGYVYFDWNVSSGDASAAATKESVLAAMKQGVQGSGFQMCFATIATVIQWMRFQNFWIGLSRKDTRSYR